MRLLLLLFLLHKLFFAVRIIVLENIRVKKCFANVVEFYLHLIEVVMQPSFEDFLNRAKLQFCGRSLLKRQFLS